MSSGTPQVAVLGGAGRPGARRVVPQTQVSSPRLRLAAFAALGLYGTLRWSTLLSGTGRGRLLGLLALALLIAGGCPLLARRNRLLAAGAAVLVGLAGLWLGGVPLGWMLNLRISVTARAIGHGVSALPQILVPYTGSDESVRRVIVLGAAVLLFDAAVLLAFAPRVMEDLRRAAIALPLVTLAAVPATLAHPRFPYLDGLLLFGLLALFIWGERIRRERLSDAIGVCLLAAVAAMAIAPALDRHRPWLDYQALAGRIAPRAVDSFNWAQTYGPISWPRHRRTVLEVQAGRPEYWKAENLDVFDGRGWAPGTPGGVPGAQSTPQPSAGALARWSQQIEVTIRDMRTSDVIGAGVSRTPTHILARVLPGVSPGTWITDSYLGPGNTYAVKVYAPDPTTAQLQSASRDYSGIAAGYRTILLPAETAPGGGGAVAPLIMFPPFHSRTPVKNVVGSLVGSGRAVIDASPYARAFRLSGSLARSAPTPYAFALAVERFLGHGYTYSENPPVRSDPLESFLFVDRRGYCQHFAGAMALLLRMGGVPARVAVGFTSGRQDTSTHRWRVTDIDAHAWVEAWFPHYGWVRFDPTPAADPALAGQSSLSTGLATASPLVGPQSAGKPHPRSAAAGRGSRRTPTGHRSTAGPSPLWPAALLAVMAGLTLLLVATRPLVSTEALVEELERALARTGGPPPAGATLEGLERGLRGSPEASAYIRGLRLARFGGAAETPSGAERRALRRQLGSGRGPVGRLRALWALPPRRAVSRTHTQRRSDA
jgi:protein-glutamine gamma-glutamyltransferase